MLGVAHVGRCCDAERATDDVAESPGAINVARAWPSELCATAFLFPG